MNTIQKNGMSIEQLEDRFEMVVADGDSENETKIVVKTN